MEEKVIGLLFGIIILFIFALFFPQLFRKEDWERKRREELAAIVEVLNLNFAPDYDFQLAEKFRFVNQLQQGDTRYAFNVISGRWQNHPIVAFDYHYCISAENRGRVHIHHHYLTALTLQMKGKFPQITVIRENWRSKLGARLGLPDINFESAEFSRTFCVRSQDKKFAYDVCNARMIEYLLANQNVDFEIEGDTLAVVSENLLPPAEIEFNLQRLLEIRSRLPEYLFAKV